MLMGCSCTSCFKLLRGFVARPRVSRVTRDVCVGFFAILLFGVDRDNDESEAKTSFARFNARVTFNHCKTLPLIGTWRCTLGAES